MVATVPTRRRLPAGAGIVALAATAFFASGAGQSFFVSVFVDPLIADTAVTRTSFSLLYAAATVFSAAVVLNVGRAIDRLGARAVWIAVAAGLAVACVTLSVAGGLIAVLVGLSLMRAFGQGSFPLLGTVLVATRFDRRRGTAMGLATQGLTLAGVAMPAIAAVLIDAFGWRTALQLVAGAIAVAILPLGLLAAGRPPVAARTPPSGGQTRAVLRVPGVRPLLVILAVSPLVVTALVVHGVSLLADHGLSATAAALALSLMAVSNALGAILAGVLADRVAPRWVLAAIGAVLAASTLLLLTRSPVVAYLAYAGLGFSNGMYATANGTVWAAAYGTATLGRLQGLAASVQIAGAAAGPLPLAVVHALTGGYEAGILLLAALGVAALVAGWRWRPPARQAGGAS